MVVEFGDVVRAVIEQKSGASRSQQLLNLLRFPTHLVSFNNKPSSTHATVVLVAPMSTTHALDKPAPTVAHTDSYTGA